ncbi:MAG: GGDEF domain-containing protein [Chloroflexi bacterium]|nr:GGDEF domain-containing protein [Chloroflexota bacterium]
MPATPLVDLAHSQPSRLRRFVLILDRMRPAHRVAAFSAMLVALAVLIYLALLADSPARAVPFAIPWVFVAAAFAVADVKVIEVHFRRESHAFSLTEVPAVIGLFFLDPPTYLLALLGGAGMGLVYLRQAPLKIAFNLANYAVLGVVMMAVFHVVPASAGIPGLAEYLAAFAATTVATVVGAVSIATAITLSGGAPQYRKLPDMLQFGLLVAMANTSIALVAVTILWASPGALWLLVIPVSTLFLAYRAWVSEREKHERLELVYQSSRILQHSPELDVALVALLDHARSMFRAEIAELVLQADGVDHRALRTTSLHDAASERLQPVEEMVIDHSLGALVSLRQAGFVNLDRSPGGRTLAGRQAMVAPLVGEGGMIGLLTVANRLTEGTSFGTDDLRLLETLANQAAVALENGHLEQSLAELSRLKEQLRYQAYHDPLTDMPNRAHFTEVARTRIAAQRPGEPSVVILLLDLDDFKNVNDTLGHAAGDELLMMVGERIRSCVREEDLAARLGGDEFAILMLDEPALGRAVAVAERLVSVLGEAYPVHGREVTVGVSIGVAASSGAGQSADELLGNADVAMYTAKGNGRRQFAVFDPTLHAAIIARHEMTHALSGAIARSELLVVHQPIVELASGRVVGLEALARWRHPSRDLVDPEEFIALAEASGAIVPLGRFMLETAAEEIRDVAGGHGDELWVSVNVSAVQIQQPDFLDEVGEVLAATGLSPHRLVLEITETAMFRDTAATIAKLAALRSRGVRIAIDDFGTGYSSLTYLRRFPVDILKIAKDFVGSGGDEGQEWAFTSAILALGKELGLTVVAEGIEHEQQLERLRGMGCELGQGYLFARPRPIGEIVFAPSHDPSRRADGAPLAAASPHARPAD